MGGFLPILLPWPQRLRQKGSFWRPFQLYERGAWGTTRALLSVRRRYRRAEITGRKLEHGNYPFERFDATRIARSVLRHGSSCGTELHQRIQLTARLR